ncbi:MAG: YraN family protein [bacterium]|nr:YraN family protein [bacterium]
MGTRTEKQLTGKIGEDIAARFLVKHGFKIIERNYLKKFGEIDIVCRKGGKVHFVEVKTVSRETLSPHSVSRETQDEYRPEDNVHAQKLKRVGRTIEVYLNEKDIVEDWEFHVVGIVLDDVRKTANVRFLQNLII